MLLLKRTHNNRTSQTGARRSTSSPAVATTTKSRRPPSCKAMVGEGAVVARTDSKGNREEARMSGFKQVARLAARQGPRQSLIQRYKGLGEMNAELLRETTMDPKVRRLLKVQIEDAIAADEIFTTLMGEEVEPRGRLLGMRWGAEFGCV